MMTTKNGVQAAADYLNGAFQTGWIPGEQEDLTQPNYKKAVTVEYVAANQIKIVGLDWSDRIQKGTRFRFKQGGDFKYFECTAVSVNADTLVTVDGHGTYTVENATITDFWFCNNVNPFGWPEAWGVETRLEAIEKTDVGGWTSGLTAVYASATSVTIAGIDATDRIQKGTKIRYKQGNDYKYDFVSEVSFATDSTLTLMGGSTVEDLPITDFAYSNIANPIGWPFGVDYIKGSNANGNWKKWADGDLEAEGTFQIAIDVATSTGELFRSDSFNIPLPYEFHSVISAQYSLTHQSDSGAYMIGRLGSSGGATMTQIENLAVYRTASGTGGTFKIGFRVKGRWEE